MEIKHTLPLTLKCPFRGPSIAINVTASMLSLSTICRFSQVMGLDWPSSRSNPVRIEMLKLKDNYNIYHIIHNVGADLPMFHETRGALVSAVRIEMCIVMGELTANEPSMASNSTCTTNEVGFKVCEYLTKFGYIF